MTAPRWLLPRVREGEFDRAWYLRVNPDVQAAGMDAWEHYVTYGHGEGRAGVAVRALEVDHILWRGFAREAEAELRLLLRGANARERAVAGWVLARHAASRGRWHTARSAIRKFTDAPAWAQFVAHPGPWLLAVQAEARLGNVAEARDLHAKAQERFAGERNLVLAAMEIALAQEAGDHAVAAHLAAIHSGTGLAPLDLARGGGSRFDRLCVQRAPPPVSGGPLVSLVVPAHDAEDTLPTCLRGLTEQSWRNLEIIVVDDGSSDRTAAIVETEARRDPRIRLLRLSVNGGAFVTRNAGFQAARGAFFTVQDADDWSHPQKIEEQVRPLLEKPALQATASHWVRAGSDLRMSRWRMEESWTHRNVSSLMIRTELRDTLGYWDRVRTNADTEYYYRLLAAFGAEAIEEVHHGVPLSFARTRPGSLTAHEATHLATQFAGARRSYMDAAHEWHRRQIAALPQPATPSARVAALRLSAQPARRPFFAPAETGPSDPLDTADTYAQVATSRYFDGAWYLRRNADVLMADVDPVRHYLVHGAFEGRDPGPLFPNAAWRRVEDMAPQCVPLLRVEARAGLALARPVFAGALDSGDRPPVLVFAHAAEREVFGAERSLLTSLERLAQGYGGERFAPVVILPSAVNADYLEQVRARAIAVEVLPQVWRHRFRPAPQATVDAIRNLVRRYRPHEVHVNTIVLDAPQIAARQEGCPTVVHVRELPEHDPGLCHILGDTARGLRRRLLSEADRFIANSRAVADWIDCPDRTAIWPNLVDPALFEESFAPDESLRVALISSNIRKKGIADFVSVALRVAELEAAAGVPEFRRCRFRLIGPASADLSAFSPLPKNVAHAGYAPGAVAALRGCDVVLILSHFAESFGRTALEAMAAGRPVICYDRGTPPTFIENGVSGFVVPPDGPEAVAQRVLALSRSRGELSNMSAQARAGARRLFDKVTSEGPRQA
jgi:glycosyltransferase involved in cell wall biosynthesis